MGRRLRFSKSIAIAAAFALAGCQILLGIDPDDRRAARDAIDASSDATWSDATRPPAKLSCTSGGGLDCECATVADCHPPLESVCEEAACIEHRCDIVARDGLACGSDGTCRGYACIGSDSLVRTNSNTTCLRASDGRVWCWGQGDYGQLGDRGSSDRAVPYLLRDVGDDLPGAVDISVGRLHGCVVLADHRTVCWGDNGFGETSGVHHAGTPPPLLPIVVAGSPPATAIAVGNGWTCVMALDGTVSCWGGYTLALGVIPGVAHATAISGAWDDMCAIAEGGLWCWGGGEYGQLGTDIENLPIPFSPDPIAIAPLGDADASVAFTAVATGEDSICALAMPGGTVECWGSNRGGQLGNGASADDLFDDGGDPSSAVPAAVVSVDGASTLGGMTRIFGGTGAGYCATATGDPFFCWGNNTDDELGFGARGEFSTPERGTSAAGAVDLALGNVHACVLRHEADGYDVSCYGDGQHGQLADGVVGEHVQKTPSRVHFPKDRGGLVMLRQNQ